MRTKSWIEVGNGEDSHYVWGSELDILDDIKSILLDLKSVGRELQGQRLTQFLTYLQKHDSAVPELQFFDDGFDLIRNHPFVSEDSEFFDPDMPVSSIWKKVYIKRSNIKKIVKLLELAKEKLEHHYECEEVPQLLKQRKRETELQKKQEKEQEKIKRLEDIRKNKEREKGIEDEWVKKTCTKIKKALKKKSGIVCINDFLIDVDNQKIYILTIHTKYQIERRDREIRVTEHLKKNNLVYEVMESPPIGTDWGHISYFSSHLISQRMGWGQSNTVLLCDNVKELENANIIRDKYIGANG